MNLLLVAVSGPLNGKTLHLTSEETFVGRDPSNDICVDSPEVSRRHCVIERKDAQLVIRDLGSHNGTFVSDVPITEKVLSNGDQIAIGDSVFVLVLDEEDEAAEPKEKTQSDDTEMVDLDVVRLTAEKTITFQRDAAQVARNLNTLLSFTTSLSSIQTINDLQTQLLTSIAEIVPAEHAAFLQFGADGAEIEPPCGWDRKNGIGARVQPNRTVVRQVIQNRTPLLVQGTVPGEPSPKGSATSAVRSILCVPVQTVGRLLGVIYLATSDPSTQFNEGHLQLMTSISSVAALAVHNARQMESLRGENRRLQQEINLEHNMVGDSSAMQPVYQIIGRVAKANSTILITGESGTGKELVARALHKHSHRKDKKLVSINCGAIPEHLLESELFGHVKGAFTGAVQARTGRFAEANGGTLFLDEIGNMPVSLQIKLLRVLQEREFEPVGSNATIKVDVRIIVATKSNLEQMVKDGTFRDDLYYRLNVIRINLPPLRERREDIPLLARHFAIKHCNQCGRQTKEISPEAQARLVNHNWPGNVRELENAIERAIVVGSADYILPEDLPENLLEGEPPPGVVTAAYHEAVAEAKKQIVRKALERASGSIVDAAKQLGLHPNNVSRLKRSLKL